MNDTQTTRRRFLLASIAFSTVAVAGATWLRGAAAAADRNTLARFGRLLFPHDRLDDAVYAGVMENVLASLAASPDTVSLLADAEQALNEQQESDWFDADEAAQIRAIENIQDKAFFAAILGTVRGAFYYTPEVWTHISYPGSSKEHGGYKLRGFNDIDWLPEGE